MSGNSKKRMLDYLKDPAVYIVVGAIISALASLVATKKQDAESEKKQKILSELQQAAIDKLKELDSKNEKLQLKQDNIINANENLNIKQDSIIKANENLNIKQDSIIKANENLNIKQTELIGMAVKNAEEQALLRQKSEEIASLNEQLRIKTEEKFNYLLGGDSYCSVNIESNDAGNFDIILFNHGPKFPLYDVSVSIWTTHLDENNSLTGQGTNELSKQVSFIRPQGRIVLKTIVLPNKINTLYYIELYARNGNWSEKYHIKTDENNELKKATKVYHAYYRGPQYGRVLYEDIKYQWTDPGFPGKPFIVNR